MLTQAQIDEFRAVGFLNVGRVYPDEEADALRDRLMTVIEGTSSGRAEAVRNIAGEDLEAERDVVIQVVNTWQADEGFTPYPDRSLVPEGEEVEIVPCEVKKGECTSRHCLTGHYFPTVRAHGPVEATERWSEESE